MTNKLAKRERNRLFVAQKLSQKGQANVKRLGKQLKNEMGDVQRVMGELAKQFHAHCSSLHRKKKGCGCK